MQKSALILIDVQKGIDNPAHGERNNPDAESNMALLLAHWRQQDLPVFHIQHCSTEPDSLLRPESPGNAIKDEVLPIGGEPVLKKNVNSAFIGTDLEGRLREQSIESVVMIGLTTDHCVSTSVRMAENLGFDVTLVSDATAAFERTGPDGQHFTAEEMHNINLASLNGEFCVVKSTREILQ